MKLKYIIFSIVLLILISRTYGQISEKVSLTEYIREVQKWEKHQNNMSLSFWLPTSYWGVALQESPNSSPEVIAQIERAFQDYVVVCALDLDILYGGSMSYTSEKELRKSLSIIDGDGKKYYPLNNKDLLPETSTFISAMKPMFEGMLGKMGSGMHFYFFKIKDKKGENIIDEYKEGHFIIKHSSREFEYKLPLTTLLPPKKCSIDNEKMKGNWNYCPIHGVKLEE